MSWSRWPTQLAPFSTAATLRSGNRVNAPWQTMADMVS